MACGRYAPSPTGRLHLGNIRTALLAWLQARLCEGKFILRIDDLDLARTRPGSLQQVITDLKWLGLDWDEGPDIGGANPPYLQSLRTHLYADSFDRLKEMGLVFPCTCSRRDIAMAQSAPHMDQPVSVYPGTCRPDPVQLRPPASDSGAADAAWRFLVEGQVLEFTDLVLGNQQQDLATEVGDFVVKRKGGLFAYQLASVVDDAMMGVTDVVRGADLVDSTPRQLALFDTLGYDRPNFWHVPLMHDNQARRLSKRDGSHSLQQWTDMGKPAATLVGHLAHSVGLINMDKPLSCRELLEHLAVLDATAFPRILSRAGETWPE